MAARPDAAFVDLSKRGRQGAGHYIFGLLIILFFWLLIGGIVGLFVIMASLGPERLLFNAARQQAGAPPANPNSPLGFDVDPFAMYLSLNLGFVCFFAGIWVAMKVALQRPLLTLVTGAGRLDWRRVGIGFGLWLLLAVVGTLVETLLYPGRYEYVLNLAKFVPFAVVVLLLTPIQTSAEELLFRGYALQWFGGAVRNQWVLAAVSGVLFMLPHLGNPEMAAGPVLLALNYFGVGFLFAIITLRSHTLELALGAHAANNLYAALIANYQNSALTTESIFLVNELDPVFGLVSLVVSGAIYYVVLSRLVWRQRDAEALPPAGLAEEGAGLVE